MKYADCPTTSVTTSIAAPPTKVWDLVSDIELPARFSSELARAEWDDGADGPALDARFTGHSQHPAIGSWDTTCVVTGHEPGCVFEWSVLGTDGDVSSIWRFTVTPCADGTTELEQWFQMGPGRGGLNPAIERMPEKEERIIERRMAEHHANMERTVAGVKELAEAAPAGTEGA